MDQVTALDRASAPGGVARPFDAEVVRRIRRLVVLAFVAAVVYSVFLTASKGLCAGGVDANGSFLDASGRATDVAPSCYQLTLGASPLVYLALAILVVAALSRVISRARDAEHAVSILDRTAVAVVIVAVASAVIAQVWFAMIPMDGWATNGVSFVAPFPFGAVEFEVTPMTRPS